MTRAALLFACAALMAAPTIAQAQPGQQLGGNPLANVASSVMDVFQHKPERPSLEPIAPGEGLAGGVGLAPDPWRTESLIKELKARASVSTHKYWAVDGSFAWQHLNDWRIEPYARVRSMKRLNFFGLGNDSLEDNQSDYSLLERTVGAYGWKRPVPWFAVGARGDVMWPRTASGQHPDYKSVEQLFPPASSPGLNEQSNFIHVQGFVNFNYPAGRNERPRRGGDYRIALGHYQDTSDTQHSFQRLELEGQERFTVFGRDRQLTLHALLSGAFVSADQTVPFYLMDTLGGADNLRGFREDIIGSDDTTATLRSFDSFRFRDASSVLFQVEFRQRLWAPLFLSVFFDAGSVAPRIGDLPLSDLHRGFGVGVSIFRANILAIRADFSIAGGEGHPHYFLPGKAFGF